MNKNSLQRNKTEGLFVHSILLKYAFGFLKTSAGTSCTFKHQFHETNQARKEEEKRHTKIMVNR